MVKLLKMNYNDEDEKPSSAQIVASIDDLLIEIIQRLPLKKIAQLKLVSKYWKSLILDPKLCLLRNQLPYVGLMYERLEEPTHIHTQSYFIILDKSISPRIQKRIRTIDASPCQILHSCNGLVLCVSNRDISRKYYVCNPTTRKYIELPEVVFDHSRLSIHGMCLAFDPSKSPHYYRVVCVLKTFYSWLHSFEVYSSETGSWRKAGDLFELDMYNDFKDGVYWNGAIHWVNIASKPRQSVYFNLDCEQTLKVFPMPPLQGKLYDINDYYFGESSDHLHFVDAHRTMSEFIVYEMKMDYSEWFVKYKYNGTIFPRIMNMIVVRGKIDEDSFLVIMIGYNRIVRYNFEQKTCETLYEIESTVRDRLYLRWYSIRLFQYIESICSV